MPFVITTALHKILKLSKRIRAIQGGTSASKTISIIQDLIDLAQRDKKPTLTSIVSESMPHLKKGCIRDFKNIMKEHDYWQESRWFETDKVYSFETGSQIEFFGADQADKLRGGRRDRLFINEANNVSFAAFEELEVRTRDLIYLDWNPVSEFWFYTEVLGKRNDVEHIKLNYLDNEALDEATKDSIEQRRNRPGWWRVYGLGELGEIEGRIYTGWQIIDEIPNEARLERYGLDFGYTNDPTAIVAVYYLNGGWILDEKVYKKGMSNKEIADTLKAMPERLVIADSAEPKSIDEIRGYGLNVQPAKKGKDSVRQGIQLVQDQPISITKQSVNGIKEFRNYLWITDKNGHVLNEPEKGNDHFCFTKDTKIEVPVGEILFKKLTGKKDVYEFMGSRVTDDHPYLTQRGFIPLKELKISDKIILWKNKLLTELSLGDIQNPKGVSFAVILHLLQRSVSATKQNAYIGIYGKNILGKYLKGMLFIMKTAIRLIIQYLISNLYHTKNTILSTLTNVIIIFLNGLKLDKMLLLCGAKHQLDKNLDINMGNLMLNFFQDTGLKETVINAEKNISQNHSMENSVMLIARLKHCGQENVYATTTSSGFFTANGVIVSNCDATRYALETLGRLKQEKSYWDRVWEQELEGKSKKPIFNKER